MATTKHMSDKGHNKTFANSETIIYENIRRITFQKPKVKRDKRGGLHKLKEMIYFLRDFGFKEKKEIVYNDVEHAIMEVTQGTDPRTIKKHLNLLVKFGYLKPIGQPLAKRTQVTVRFNEKVNAKTYTSKKGNTSYVFGIMAPKRYVETVFSVPLSTPPSNEDERVSKMLDRVGVTSKECVRVNDEDSREAKENGENVSIEKKEEETIAHTYQNNFAVNTAKTNDKILGETEINTFTAKPHNRNASGCFIKKPKGGP